MDFKKVGRSRLVMRWPRHQKLISDANFLAINDLMRAYGIAVLNRRLSRVANCRSRHATGIPNAV